MSAPLVSIECDSAGASLFCPVCGKQLLFPETGPSGCEHLLFAWIDLVGDFEGDLTRPEIRAIAASLEDDEDFSTVCDPAFLERLPSNSVVFALTENAMVHGCGAATAVLGVQFPDS